MATKLKKSLGKIHHGDCLKGLQTLTKESVDLAFADPPFNIGYEYDEYDDRLEADKYVAWCSDWMSEIHRVLKKDGTFWLAIGDDFAAELKIAAQQLGFQTRNWVIWYYTFGVHCKSKFTRSHTHLFYFTIDPKEFTFNFSGVAVPSARQLVYNDKRSNPAGRSPDDTWILRPQDCEGFSDDEDTWYFPRVAGTFKERAGFHTCQMPEQLLGRIVRGCSNPDDIVMDPFSGSGTTLAVAKKLGRKYLGFEMSEDYVKFGMERLAACKAGDALQGAKEPRVSAPATRDGKPLNRKKVAKRRTSKKKKQAEARVSSPANIEKPGKPNLQLDLLFEESPAPAARTKAKAKPKAKATKKSKPKSKPGYSAAKKKATAKKRSRKATAKS